MLVRLNFGLDAKLTRKIWSAPLCSPCSPRSPAAHPLLTLLTHLTFRFTLQSGKGLKFHAMPIGTIETVIQVVLELVYGRADGMPNSLQSMVVCDCYSLENLCV
jgi:hypothetical protein